MTASMHRVARDYILGRAANLVLAPISIIVLPGLLGDSAYAKYSYWFGLVSIYIVLLDMGSQLVLRRFLPELINRPENAAARLFKLIHWIKLLPLSLIAIAIFFSKEPITLIILLATAVFATLLFSFTDIYYAYQYMGRQALLLVTKKLLRLILVPSLFFLWQLPGILVALLLAELIPFLLSSKALKLLDHNQQKLDKPLLFYYSFGFIGFITFLLATLMGRSPVLIAEWYHLDLATIGHIALAVDISYFALKEFINSLTESILPRLINYKTNKLETAYQDLIDRNYRFVNFITLFVIALILPLSPALLLLLGSNYYLASLETQILLVAILFASWNAIHNQILITHNQAHKIALAHFIAFCSLCTIIINVAVVDILILAQALFCALAILALSGYFLSRPHRQAAYRQKQNQSTTTLCFIRLLPATLIVIALLLYWQPRGISMTFAAIVVGSILYLSIAIISRGISRSDVKHIKKLLFGG